jgi:hypothetical protein
MLSTVHAGDELGWSLNHLEPFFVAACIFPFLNHKTATYDLKTLKLNQSQAGLDCEIDRTHGGGIHVAQTLQQPATVYCAELVQTYR